MTSQELHASVTYMIYTMMGSASAVVFHMRGDDLTGSSGDVPPEDLAIEGESYRFEMPDLREYLSQPEREVLDRSIANDPTYEVGDNQADLAQLIAANFGAENIAARIANKALAGGEIANIAGVVPSGSDTVQ